MEARKRKGMIGGRTAYGALWIMRGNDKVEMVCTQSPKPDQMMKCCDSCPFFREPYPIMKHSDLSRKGLTDSGLIGLELCNGALAFESFSDKRND